MPTITEGQLSFTFPANWEAAKFDVWSFYVNQFQNLCGGAKAVDIIALDSASALWIIEVKDYRQHVRTKSIHLADEIATKVRDSLAALAVARTRANNATEKRIAGKAMRCKQLRVVLHLEQPANPSKLFPLSISPAAIRQKLKQTVRAIDPHALVVDTSSQTVPWSTA